MAFNFFVIAKKLIVRRLSLRTSEEHWARFKLNSLEKLMEGKANR